MAPLDGLRVLDLTMWRPGPYATPLLSHAEMLGLEHFRHRRIQEEGPVRTSVHPPLPGGTVAELDEHSGQTWRLTQ
ncbi:Uncharacterised protein [Mycobacterium tuberculosis]|nr:Uncharacterised protein [Mycobacterium tuberculosis]